MSQIAAYKYAKIEAQLISKESGKADYFNVTFTKHKPVGTPGKANYKPAYVSMSFTPAVNASSPLRDVESELVITLTDAFGHNDMVYKFPFTVKKR